MTSESNNGVTAYPLSWPNGRKRAAAASGAHERKDPMTATMTDGRWTAEVLEVAAGIVAVQGIPHVDAIDIARRRVAKWRAVPLDHVASPRRRLGRFQMVLRLGDAEAVVWVRG